MKPVSMAGLPTVLDFLRLWLREWPTVNYSKSGANIILIAYKKKSGEYFYSPLLS